MAETLKTCTGFMSVRTDSSGRRVWQAISHNQPLNAPTESMGDALAVAKSVFGRVTLAVWDGDKGEFDSELLADPNY